MRDFSKINNFNRERGHITCVCGESGSGKSTYVKNQAQKNDVVFDGDGVRYYINNDLDYSTDDRRENNIRLAKIANYLALQGFNVFIATVRADIAFDYLISHSVDNISLYQAIEHTVKLLK